MIKMRPYVPSQHIVIKDSLDDDYSDDIEDDVFIRDIRSAKLNEEKGLKRPLMPPKRRNGKLSASIPIMKRQQHFWRRCCEPFCYILATITIITSVVCLIGLMLSMSSVSMEKFRNWWQYRNAKILKMPLNDKSVGAYRQAYVPCTQIRVQKLWSRTYPRMNSESPLRKTDLNGDNILDIIFGFGVDDNIQYEGYSLPKCRSPLLGDDVPCDGGVVAVDGRDGSLLWQTWSVANVFSLLCNLDINLDGYPDCVAAGKLGMIFSINGRNGNNIWELDEPKVDTNSPIVMDLYTINVIRDLDGDGIPEIMAAHLEEREDSKVGQLKIIAGKTGRVIRSIFTPHHEEVFAPIQLVTREDGTEVLLIITGGQNANGGVYSIRLLSLMQDVRDSEFTTLYHQEGSGVLVPAIITDITGDQVADVVIAAFNATVMAFDGRNYSMLWNYTFAASDTISAIVPGRFNNDNITDFMVKYNTGPGFPIYYYSQTTILDGRNGRSLLDNVMLDSGGAHSLLGGISISQTFGSDFFLHWQLLCLHAIDNNSVYDFLPDSDMILQARADACRLRYNTSSVVKLYGIAHHIEPPGAVLFSTDDLEIHLNRTQLHGSVNPYNHKSKSPLKHPKLLRKLLQEVAAVEKFEDDPFRTNALLNNPNLDLDGLEEEVFTRRNLPVNDINQKVLDSYTSYNDNRDIKKRPKDYDIELAPPIDYESNYIDNEIPELIPTNDRPIHLRSKYPENHNRRRDVKLQNMWDLSKEHNVVSSKDHRSYRLFSNQTEGDSSSILYNQKLSSVARYRRRSEGYSENATTVKGSNNETLESDEWFLASISSTGVLLSSLNGIKSSIDFAFILNIRESETYPPLLLPQDINCVDAKLNAYKKYTRDNLRLLRKQFLKQCLNERLIHLEAPQPQYESQLIVTRIGITCTCRNLQIHETCSEFQNIQEQKWTEYMGNYFNGYYTN